MCFIFLRYPHRVQTHIGTFHPHLCQYIITIRLMHVQSHIRIFHWPNVMLIVLSWTLYDYQCHPWQNWGFIYYVMYRIRVYDLLWYCYRRVFIRGMEIIVGLLNVVAVTIHHNVIAYKQVPLWASATMSKCHIISRAKYALFKEAFSK